MGTYGRQIIRFTGERTGLEATSLKGYGRVEVGDEVEVTTDEADRWTQDLPMRNGEVGSDFVKVGDLAKVVVAEPEPVPAPEPEPAPEPIEAAPASKAEGKKA